MANVSQEVKKGTGFVTRSAVSNEKGYHNFTETTTNGGDYYISSDLKSQELHSTDKETAVKGNDISDVRGNSSRIISGINETVCGSDYKIVGTAEMYNGSYQELANKAQLRLVATRSMPDKVPDTSLLGMVKKLLKPKPHLLSSIVQPECDELQDQIDQLSPPTTLGQSIELELATYLAKMGIIANKCTMDTAVEVVKVQAKYTKACAKQQIKEKQKTMKKMSKPSLAAFKENFGAILFPEEDDGDISLKSFSNALNTVTDPKKLAGLFIPLAPPEDGSTMVKAYDETKAQQEIAKCYDDVFEAERHLC